MSGASSALTSSSSKHLSAAFATTMPKSAKQLPPTIVLEPLAMMALDHTVPSAEGEEIEVTGHDVDMMGPQGFVIQF